MKKEITRKAIHILFGTLFLALIYFAGTQMSTLIIGLFLIAGTLISIGITRGHKFPFIEKIVECVERENEKPFPGKAAVLFFISAIILLVLFKNNPSVIMAALSVQVFGDSAAALIGTKYGKHKLYKKKTWEGSITCLIVSIICINIFFPLQIAIIAGIIATLVEILPLDDNLFVPLITAAAIRTLI
ncbi:MAG: diacylglycerol/polyprenol kinase family protein [archaeon]